MDIDFNFLLILLALFVAFYLPFIYGKFEALNDAEKIIQDGSRDSLKEAFHTSNATRRGIIIGLMCAGEMALGYFFAGLSLWVLPVLFLYNAAAFGYRFTTKLNTLRGLQRYYVSPDPRASITDRMFVYWAAEFGMPPHRLSAILHSGFLLLSVLFLLIILVKNV